MVRAAGFGVVSGSCSPLFGGVSGGVVATLVGRAGEVMRRDDTPSVRAAACKVIGSLACVPPLATEPQPRSHSRGATAENWLALIKNPLGEVGRS